MISILQGISDAIADRPDRDMTRRMLIGLGNWPIGYRIGYWLFCQRGSVKNDCYASFAVMTVSFIALLVLAAMYL